MKQKCFLFFIVMLGLSINSYALVINVPGNYSTIASAIGAATNGDTVLVEPGTYYENLNFRGKNIVLTSRFYLAKDTSYICTTIIDGSQPASPDTASCIILNSGEDTTAIIQGFTITGGTGTAWFDTHGAGTYREGGGILTEFSSPIIRWNYIINNLVLNTTGVSSTGGGGIRCGDGHPKVYGNLFSNNQARYGAGLVFNYCTNAEVRNNLIVYNEGGQSFGGGGIWATGNGGDTLIVENNSIANNHVTGTGTYGGKGGGIFVFTIKIVSKNNIIWGNTQVTGNGIWAVFPGAVTAEYSDINFSYAGNGNINSDPLFVDSISFLLNSNSPCVDAGDSSATYNDLTASASIAAFPSLGTERNDIGAYGGPDAKYFSSCNPDPSYINEKLFSQLFTIVPNPVQEALVIQSTKNSLIQVEIYSVTGKKVLSRATQTNTAISINNLPAGLYFIEISSASQSYNVKKIIIKT